MTKLSHLSELYNADYQLSSLFGLAQYWHDKKRFSMIGPRPTYALLLFVGCDAVYTERTSGKQTQVEHGSLFFLSAGTTYTWNFSNTKEGEVSTLLLEFSLSDTDGAPMTLAEGSRLLSAEPSEHTVRLFEKAVAELSAPSVIPARAKAAMYSLLADVSGEGRVRGILDGRFAIIEKSIRYLEKDPTQRLSIAEVAALSNVSTNYFERLFKDYAGVSPTEYRAARKIERAERLLRETLLSVGEIALHLGFEDEAYFCRFFKLRKGLSPGAYRKQKRL